MAHVRPLTRTNGKLAYEVRWRQGGKEKQRTFAVKRDAERFALRMEDAVHAGEATDVHVRRGKTVSDAVEESMAIAELKLKRRTFNSYRQGYDRHIIPVFGARRISAITSADVERWVADLSASGLAPATVRNTFVALNKVFRYAVRHGCVTRNPCTGTELPRPTHEQRFAPRFLTPAEVEAIANVLDAEHPYGLIVRFASYTGLRAGEIAGLQVRVINLLRREVAVDRTLQRINGEWVTDSPKSVRSRRNVPLLHADLLTDLAAYLGEHPDRHTLTAALWPGRRPGTHDLDWDRPFDQGSFYRWYYKWTFAHS